MKGLIVAASLTLVLGAAPVFAQATAGSQAPARPAPAAPATAGQAPARPAQPAAAPAQQPAPAPLPPAPFPAGAKIAFVNLQVVAQASAEGKAANAKVQALAQKKQTEAADRAKALQTNQQKLETSGAVMNDAARTQLQKEIERQQVEGQRFEQDAQAELNELQQELQQEFQQKLMPVLEQLSQEKGLHALFSAADAGLIWADRGIDLTEETVKRLDAITAKGAPTTSRAPAAPATGAAPAAAPAPGSTPR